MPNRKSASEQVIDGIIEERVASENSGIDDIRADAMDGAAQRMGAEIVTYSGGYRMVQPRGASEGMDTPQLTNVNPDSKGRGLLEKVPGWGDESSQGSTIKAGRISEHSEDTDNAWKAKRTGLNAAAINSTNQIQIQELTVNVPVAKGVTAYLEALGAIEVAAENATTGIDVQIVIGTDNSIAGKYSMRLEGAGALGDVFSTGGDMDWHIPLVSHARVYVGTEETQTAGVPVYIQLKKYTVGGGSGGGGGTSAKFAIGDNWACNSNSVNVRSSPSVNSSAVAQINIGSTGTIAGGPSWSTSGTSYKWWQLTSPSGWVAEQFLNNTTPRGAAPASTSRYRSGWLTVKREAI